MKFKSPTSRAQHSGEHLRDRARRLAPTTPSGSSLPISCLVTLLFIGLELIIVLVQGPLVGESFPWVASEGAYTPVGFASFFTTIHILLSLFLWSQFRSLRLRQGRLRTSQAWSFAFAVILLASQQIFVLLQVG